MAAPILASNSLIESSLDLAVAEAFEGLFFLEVAAQAEGLEAAALGEDFDGYEVRLDILGNLGMRLCLQISSEAALQMIANFPLALSPSDMKDLFAELANTIGGRFASAVSGEDAYDLSIPEVRHGRLKRAARGERSRSYRTELGFVHFILRAAV